MLRARHLSRIASATSDFALAIFGVIATFGTTQYTDVFAQAANFPARTSGPMGHSFVDCARAFHRRLWQVGPTSAARLAAGRDGWPNSSLGIDSRRDDGHRRSLHGDAHKRHLPAFANDDDGGGGGWRGDGDLCGDDRHHSKRHQEGPGVFDRFAARFHVHGLRRRARL